MIRIFAQWLNGIDSRNEVPPRGLIPDRSQRPCPYIYSELEIRRILAAAAELPSRNGLRALTYVTLFGLIAVTGLRVSEAVALDNEDVDLVRSVLTIQRGKLGMDPGREMLTLCTYLGHLGPEHTYWYIEAIPELMELAAKRAERSLNQESVQ